jgi:hypothetical protein
MSNINSAAGVRMVADGRIFILSGAGHRRENGCVIRQAEARIVNARPSAPPLPIPEARREQPRRCSRQRQLSE